MFDDFFGVGSTRELHRGSDASLMAQRDAGWETVAFERRVGDEGLCRHSIA